MAINTASMDSELDHHKEVKVQESTTADQRMKVAHGIDKTSVLTRRQHAGRIMRGGPVVSWVSSILVVLAIWQIAAEFVVGRPSVFPTLPLIFRAGMLLVANGFQGQTLLSDVLASVARIGIGFGLAVVLGIFIGFMMTVSRMFFRVIDPWLQFIRPIPPLAYIPLLIVWFGIGVTPKILTIIVGTIPVIILGTIGGARAVPIDMVRGAQCLGATRFQVLRLVIFPSTLPEIFTAMRTGIGIAWTYLVAAELIAARSGLGWLVQNAAQSLSIATVLAAIVIIGALGYAMDGVIRIAEYFIVPWKGKI